MDIPEEIETGTSPSLSATSASTLLTGAEGMLPAANGVSESVSLAAPTKAGGRKSHSAWSDLSDSIDPRVTSWGEDKTRLNVS